MKLQKLVLSDFGKFHQEEIVLGAGLNIATGSNESGKTTIRRFIRSMLYGMERERGIRARQDDYTRYRPWEYGRYQGSMEFELDGRSYRLFRNFLSTEKQTVLTELATGKEIALADRFLKEQGLVPETVYVNTFWVGNFCATEEILARELKDYLANLAYSGGAGLNLQKSYAWLATRKKELERELPEAELRACRELVMQTASVQQRLKEAVLELRGQEEQSVLRKQKMEQTEKQVEQLLLEREAAEAKRELFQKGKRCLGAGLGVAVLLVLLGSFFPSASVWLWAAAGVCALVGGAFGVPDMFRGRKGREEERALLEQVLGIKSEQQREFEAELGLKVAMDRSERLVEQLEEQLRSCETAQKRMEELQQMRQESLKKIEAIRVATETIQRLSVELYEEFGQKFARALSSYVQDFTDHAYETLTAEENLTLRAVTAERTVTIPEVSFGTGEQFYLALRFAAADVFDPEKKIPMILDDSFAAFDEQRLESAILALEKCGRQILVLSSTGREEQAAKRMGIPYEKVF